MAARLEDLLDPLALALLEIVELEQLAEADDGVEGGAQLVAHAREELALRPVGALGLGPGGLGGALGQVAVGDVV